MNETIETTKLLVTQFRKQINKIDEIICRAEIDNRDFTDKELFDLTILTGVIKFHSHGLAPLAQIYIISLQERGYTQEDYIKRVEEYEASLRTHPLH